MTIEDMKAIVALLKESQGGGGKGDFKKDLLKNLQSFDGTKEKYADWALKVFMNINTIDEKIADVMKATEKKEKEMGPERMNELKIYYTEDKGYKLDTWSKQLYEVLGIKLESTAFSILKSVEHGNGFGEWRRLRTEAKPTTPVGALKEKGLPCT